MNNKTPQPKRKIADVTKPTAPAAADTEKPQVIIEKRARIAPSDPTDQTVAEDTPSTTAPAVKHTDVTPPAATNETPADKSQAPKLDSDTAAADTTAPAPVVAATRAEAVPKAEAIETPESESADATPSAPTVSHAITPANDIAQKSDLSSDIDDSKKPDAEAAEAAAQTQENKRQEQVDGYIDTREFFVPINAAARKRSIEVSLWLTLVYIILSVILVDLMLDTGMIDLLHKVPHTNFF